jgi:hypothetical protein
MGTPTPIIATPIIASLQSIVSSFEQFTLVTKLPLFLSNCLSDTTKNTQWNTFYAGLFDENKTSYQEIVDLVFSMTAPYNTGTMLTDDDNAYKDIFNADIHDMVSILNANMAPLSSIVANDNIVPIEYSAFVKTICDSTLHIVLQQVSAHCKGANDSSCNSVKSYILSNVSGSTDIIIKQLLSTIHVDIGDVATTSFDAYLDNIVTNFTLTGGLLNVNLPLYYRKLCFIAFLPYFAFMYISYFLPSKNIQANNFAPRDVTTRQIAILCIYKIMTYSLFTMYKTSSMVSPANEDTNRLGLLLDDIVTSLFGQDIDVLKNLVQDETQHTNMSDFADLQNVNRNISMVRSQITNIAANKKFLEREYYSACVWVYFWIVLCVVYCVAGVAMYFIANNKIIEYFFMVSSGIFITIMMIGLYKIAS